MSRIKNWINESRPRTLSASLSPVIIATALAISEGYFILNATLLCIGVAIFAQIASNFANDYFDLKQGIDNSEVRLGPERALLKGTISARAILIAAITAIVLACLCGLGLLFYSSWEIIIVGIFIAAGVFAYSAGPYPLSQHGLGDAAVLVFYGIIPVCFTFYVQAGFFSYSSLIWGIAIGLLSVNILIMNNYRDVEQDRAAGKYTTVVLFGKRAMRSLYLINIFIAATILAFYSISALSIAFALLFVVIALKAWWSMGKLIGKDLNRPFAVTAILVLIYSLLSASIILKEAICCLI